MLLGRWNISFFPVFLSERTEKTIRLPPGQGPKDKGRSEEVGSLHPRPVTGLLTAGNSCTGSVWGGALAQPGHTAHRSWLCTPQQSVNALVPPFHILSNGSERSSFWKTLRRLSGRGNLTGPVPTETSAAAQWVSVLLAAPVEQLPQIVRTSGLFLLGPCLSQLHTH